MDSALFDYPLPPASIAQSPADPRDSSRLLLVDRASRRISHHVFRELPALLPPGTRLFRNNAAVLKARLRFPRPTGGRGECLLLHPHLPADPTGHTWWCLLKPGRKLPPGATFSIPGAFTAIVLEKTPDGPGLVRFEISSGQSVPDLADQFGEPPLPPYIHRAGHSAAQRARDAASYQTVYADPAKKIAAAAPTAGLHFTPAVLAGLAARGFSTHDLALRVGLDTFRPISAERLEDHPIHREWYEIPPATRAAVTTPGGPRLAVGTTTLRALEDYLAKITTPIEPAPVGTPLPVLRSFSEGERGVRDPSVPFNAKLETRNSELNQPWLAEAALFIYPPRTFAAADLLLTNFHLPRSTLLCLVSAFLTPGDTTGIAWLKEIYADALARGYRFFSYGDAMLIL
jgi:S-adenosylmethionine:tRNA ribosyltransferase-isomerase